MISYEYIKASKGSDSKNERSIILLVIFAKHRYHDGEEKEARVFPITELVRNENHDSLHESNLRKDLIYFNLKLINVKGSEKAKFATKTDIYLPEGLRGFGIGTYIMSNLIQWGANKKPDYPVERLRLSHFDAKIDEDRDLRNSFYEKLGFYLEFDNEERREGIATTENLSQLTPRKNFNKIERISLADDVCSKSRENIELKRRLDGQKEWIVECKNRNYNLKKQRNISYGALLILVMLWYLYG